MAHLTQPARSSLVSQPCSSSELELGTGVTGSGCYSSCRWADFVCLPIGIIGSTSRASSSEGPEFAVDIVVAPSDWLMIKRKFDCLIILFRRMWLLGLPIAFALVSFT